MAQYRVEVISQMNYQKSAHRTHKGDIARSRDVATVIYDNTVSKYHDMIKAGFMQYVWVRVMARYGYFGTWRELESTTMTEDDKETPQ